MCSHVYVRRALNRYLSRTQTRSFSSTTGHVDVHSLWPRKGDRVVVGMSGGVDSSVSALLLAQEDYDLSAVYMRNWDSRDESGTDIGCEWEKDWEDVQLVCRKVGIPCKLIDLSREYWNRVFEPSLRHWEAGATPNPDVWCNRSEFIEMTENRHSSRRVREIKFGALLERLTVNKDTWLATGHYAFKDWSTVDHHSPHLSERPKLLRPNDHNKDQTYFLSSISESALRRALFPLGHLTKPQVRELAKKHELSTAERRDSVGICFVGKRRNFDDFLGSYIPPKPGPIIDKVTGRFIGVHQGLWHYTVGQNARLAGMTEKMFVVGKDAKTNAVLVAPARHESLFSRVLLISNFSWIWKDAPPSGIDSPEGASLIVQHRYRSEPQKCIVKRILPNDVRIECEKPQHAITPGQIATLWDGDWCLGSGVIESSS